MGRGNTHGQVTDQADALYRHTLSSYAYGPGPGTGAGDLTEIDYADGGSDLYAYDPATYFHEVITDTNALAHGAGPTYDPNTGDRLSSTDGLNNTTVYAYYQSGGVSNGLLMSMTDPDHNTTTYQYEPGTRRLSILTDAATDPTTTHYDANGNVSSVTDARTFTTYATMYDNRNRLTRQNPPRVRHGGHGLRPVWRRDLAHDSEGRVTATTFDQRGWPTAQTTAQGTPVAETTLTGYDEAGNVTSTTDAQRQDEHVRL